MEKEIKKKPKLKSGKYSERFYKFLLEIYFRI